MKIKRETQKKRRENKKKLKMYLLRNKTRFLRIKAKNLNKPKVFMILNYPWKRIKKLMKKRKKKRKKMRKKRISFTMFLTIKK